ncbi:alpha-1,2 mannosyl-transferase [Radiomyces spectabilis]|uniref:alpha-1,2 mannosyl-transferase n=1 Tax=Radiomyces spectabilis TaxID=64574 RepID=UPI00221EC62B|nr:alpha-1,2 mannosyl-transferase [Radiomyces spectabilis]KAI8393582.1 alpha-1,2 mannosyl-transferase [Radiomyces spectabilis]
MVTFIKNDRGQLNNLRFTMRNLEDNFNFAHGYPYVVFSNENLSDEFKELLNSITRGQVFFETLDKHMYGYAPSIDLIKAAKARKDMKNVMFGDDEDYRFQSRFMSGMIFRHPILKNLDYYWRIEAGTEYVCPINFDPFQYMQDHDKKLSFSMALYEYHETIPTLYDTAMQFASEHETWIQKNQPGSLWKFILNESQEYNRCHFWSNFQIADLKFFQSEQYQAFFDYLDKAGGFFYERWGDPVIHSLAAVLFLEKEQVHFWDNIGYRVANSFTHCPTNLSLYSQCSCRPQQNFDNDGYSCLQFFLSA